MPSRAHSRKPTRVTVRFLEPGGGPVERPLLRAVAGHPGFGFWHETGKFLTASNGAMMTWSLKPGRWEVLAHFEGLVPWVHQIDVMDSEPIDLGEATLDEGVSIEGIVVDGAGMPIPEVYLQVTNDREGSQQSGAGGRFRLDALPRGEVSIRAYHEDYIPRTVDLDLRKPQSRLRIQLARGSRVTMRVRAPAGVVFPEALEWRMTHLEADTAEDFTAGDFDDDDEAVTRVLPGRYRLELRFGDTRLAHEDVVLEDGTDVTVTLRLPGP